MATPSDSTFCAPTIDNRGHHLQVHSGKVWKTIGEAAQDRLFCRSPANVVLELNPEP